MNTDKLRGLPVLTLIQPWASWVAMGWKTGETRTSSTLLNRIAGKYFLVHAGKAWDPEALGAAEQWLTHEQKVQTHSFLEVRGQILALALAGKPRVMHPSDEPSALIGCSYTAYTPKPEVLHRWVLPLERVEPLDKPIPARGQQGIWYYK